MSRLVKRRTLAKQICDAGRVSVNERKAKASTNVGIEDILAIRYGNKTMTVEVKKILDHPRRDESAELYQVLSTSTHATGQEIDQTYVDDEDEDEA